MRKARHAIAWIVCLCSPAGIAPRVDSVPQDNPKPWIYAGRVVDGLDRPLAGVTVTASVESRGKRFEAAALSDDAGKYSVSLVPPADDPERIDDVGLTFFKQGYEQPTIYPSRPGRMASTTIRRHFLIADAATLRYTPGEELVNGLREVLASVDYEAPRLAKIATFLFLDQEDFRPALRQLINDKHVGGDARFWLELLGDPADDELFPNGRRFAPKQPVKETDVIEALRAAARQRNFFTSNLEPRINLDEIVFTRDLTRVMIKCCINCAALTGVHWEFIFHKVEGAWVLRSVREAGRS